MATAKISDATFESEVLNSSEPVVVDFWAEWCGPCRAIGPSLEEISEEMAGKVKIVKLNVDENPEIATRFGISAIPMLMMFKGGEHVATQRGAAPKSKLVSWIETSVA